jgi:hypothetical protein
MTSRYECQRILLKLASDLLPDSLEKLQLLERISHLPHTKLNKVKAVLSRQLTHVLTMMVSDPPVPSYDSVERYLSAVDQKLHVVSLYEKHVGRPMDSDLFEIIDSMTLDLLLDMVNALEDSLEEIEGRITARYGPTVFNVVNNMEEVYRFYQRLATENIQTIIAKYRNDLESPGSSVHSISSSDFVEQPPRRITRKTVLKRLTDCLLYLVGEVDRLDGLSTILLDFVWEIADGLAIAAGNIARCMPGSFYENVKVYLERLTHEITRMLCTLDDLEDNSKDEIIPLLEHVQTSLIEELEANKPLRPNNSNNE